MISPKDTVTMTMVQSSNASWYLMGDPDTADGMNSDRNKSW